MKITPNSRLTFGTNKGLKLRDVPESYLKWMENHLWDGEFHQWAVAAKKELADRKHDNRFGSLEEQADDILRQAGFDPDRVS